MLLGLVFLFYGCKKIDSSFNEVRNTSAFSTSKFFDIPANTNPAVQRVIAEIKRRESKTPFVAGFAASNGFPQWENAMMVRTKNRSTNNFAGGNPGDTVLYIPLVLTDSGTVNGFIRASLQDSSGLSYYLSKDYKAYPILNNDSLMTQDDYALLIMKLNQLTFGYQQFLTTDTSLFRNITNDGTASPTTIHFANNINTNLQNGSGLQTSSILYCEIVTVVKCAVVTNSLQQSNITGHGCPTITLTIATCWESSLPGGGGGGTGGGTGGGGGGGGTGIPYSYPCLANGQNPLLSNSVIPNCPPPGGGPGWVPIVDDALLDYSDLDNPIIVNDDIVRMPLGFNFQFQGFGEVIDPPIRTLEGHHQDLIRKTWIGATMVTLPAF